MQPTRIRLSEFADWIGETKPSLRGLMARSEVPFNPDATDGTQRTYDGADLLAWFLFVQLRRVGISARIASEAVALSSAVENFFKGPEEGIVDQYLIFYVVRRENAHRGKHEIPYSTLGTSDAVAEILKGESTGYGKPNFSGDIRLGLVSLVTVPLMPCLYRCEQTALEHGFEMVGPDLFEIEK